MFVRLIDGSHGIIAETACAIVLDMRAQHVRHAVTATNFARRSMLTANAAVSRTYRSTGIKRVTGEQDSGAPIVERDARWLMTRNRKHVEHPAAEIDDSSVGRPASDVEERTYRAPCHDRRRPCSGDARTVNPRRRDRRARDCARRPAASAPRRLRASHWWMRLSTSAATSTFPAPVSNSNARSRPKIR